MLKIVLSFAALSCLLGPPLRVAQAQVPSDAAAQSDTIRSDTGQSDSASADDALFGAIAPALAVLPATPATDSRDLP